MAKVTLVLEDDFKDGNPVIKGSFTTSDTEAPPKPGAPVAFTAAQLYMETVKRMWDDTIVNILIRRYVPDMLHHNDMIKKLALAELQQKANDGVDPEEGPVHPLATMPVKDADNAPGEPAEQDCNALKPDGLGATQQSQ